MPFQQRGAKRRRVKKTSWRWWRTPRTLSDVPSDFMSFTSPSGEWNPEDLRYIQDFNEIKSLIYCHGPFFDQFLSSYQLNWTRTCSCTLVWFVGHCAFYRLPFSSESVKQRTNMFYLHPERCCVPNSPLWFSSTPLDDSTMEAMLTRILTVRELHIRTKKDGGVEPQASHDPPFIPDMDEDEDSDWLRSDLFFLVLCKCL